MNDKELIETQKIHIKELSKKVKRLTRLLHRCWMWIDELEPIGKKLMKDIDKEIYQ